MYTVEEHGYTYEARVWKKSTLQVRYFELNSRTNWQRRLQIPPIAIRSLVCPIKSTHHMYRENLRENFPSRNEKKTIGFSSTKNFWKKKRNRLEQWTRMREREWKIPRYLWESEENINSMPNRSIFMSAIWNESIDENINTAVSSLLPYSDAIVVLRKIISIWMIRRYCDRKIPT